MDKEDTNSGFLHYYIEEEDHISDRYENENTTVVCYEDTNLGKFTHDYRKEDDNKDQILDNRQIEEDTDNKFNYKISQSVKCENSVSVGDTECLLDNGDGEKFKSLIGRNIEASNNGRKQYSTAAGIQEGIRKSTLIKHITIKNINKCNECQKRFRSKCDLKRHKLIHQGIKKYKCAECSKCFLLKAGLMRHKLLNHNKFKCKQCEEHFPNKRQLNKHAKGKHPGILCCQKCGKTYNIMKHYQQHMTTHGKFACGECRKCYDTKNYLRKHMVGVHIAMKNFKCDTCNKSFKTNSKLRRHKQSHESIRNFKCDECRKCYDTKNYLRKHMVGVHTAMKNFKCDTCNKSFKTNPKLRRHKQSHESIRNFKCDSCNKYFRDNAKLKRHCLTHFNENKCTECRKIFYTTELLNQHLEVHAGAKVLKCAHCDEVFKTKDVLKLHIAVVHIRNFSCDICEETFKSRYYLYQHKRKHTNGMDFKCDVCHKCYAMKCDLKKHIVIHVMRYTCEKCRGDFSSKSDLCQHLQVHTEQSKYQMESEFVGITNDNRNSTYSAQEIVKEERDPFENIEDELQISDDGESECVNKNIEVKVKEKTEHNALLFEEMEKGENKICRNIKNMSTGSATMDRLKCSIKNSSVEVKNGKNVLSSEEAQFNIGLCDHRLKKVPVLLLERCNSVEKKLLVNSSKSVKSVEETNCHRELENIITLHK